MKNRLMVVAEYFPPRLGSDRRIFELTKRLAAKYDIRFVTLPPSYTLFIRKIDVSDGGEAEVSSNGMIGYRLRLPKLISRFWNSSFLVAFGLTEIYLCLQMLKKTAQLKPDLIIINDTSVYTGLLGFVCSKIMRKKLLVDYNDLMGLYTAELLGQKKTQSFGTVFGRGFVMIEDFLVKSGWRVTAITEFIRNYAKSRNIMRDIALVPNGVDTALFDPARAKGEKIRAGFGVKSGEKLCVYAGRIEEVAGAEIILQTAQILKSETSIKFMIVGEGNSGMVSRLSKCGNVILTGRVPNEEIPNYIAAADCVFVPFPNDVASHGISPLKLFEALAMEKPVIASAISGIREAAGKAPNVFLVSNDPESWASTVLSLFEKNEGKGETGQQAREFIRRNYDFDHLAKTFGAVIAEGF